MSINQSPKEPSPKEPIAPILKPKPAITKPTDINRDTFLLHPVFLTSVNEVLHQMELDRIPFRVFEGYRSPARQAYLYTQGRTRPGNKVTNAQAWQSFHQYGLAVDFALFLANKWTWDASGEFADCWHHLHEVGEFYGLRHLDFEQPHLQLDGVELVDLRAAVFPSGGSPEWWANLDASIRGWNSSPAAPRAAVIGPVVDPVVDPVADPAVHT